jgi:hypothetical protein
MGRRPLFGRCGRGVVDGRGKGAVLCGCGRAVKVGAEAVGAVHGRDRGRGGHCGHRCHGQVPSWS